MANPTYTLIASNTVGSGGASSVTFSSIPATYTDLVIRCSSKTPFTSGNSSIDTISFNGSSTSFSGIYFQAYGTGINSGSYAQFAAYSDGNVSATTNTFSNTDIYIPNYTSSNNKTYSSDSVSEANASTPYMVMVAGLWANSSAITSITLTPYSTFLQYSTFYLYGINNS